MTRRMSAAGHRPRDVEYGTPTPTEEAERVLALLRGDGIDIQEYMEREKEAREYKEAIVKAGSMTGSSVSLLRK